MFLSQAIEVAQIMDQSLEENNSELVLRCIELSDSRISNSTVKGSESPLVPFFSCFSASWVYSKVVLLGISFLEHENRYGLDSLVMPKASCGEFIFPFPFLYFFFEQVVIRFLVCPPCESS